MKHLTNLTLGNAALTNSALTNAALTNAALTNAALTNAVLTNAQQTIFSHLFAGIKRTGAHMDKSDSEMGAMAFEKWAKRSTLATVNELTYAAKPYVDETQKREVNRRMKFAVPRARKRFQQLKAKSNVIYV